MKYLEGDVVRGVNGDTMVQGVVFFEYGRTELKDVGWSVEALETQGFTVEMVRAVPRPLPTEDGLYMIQNSDGPCRRLRPQRWGVEADRKRFHHVN